MKKIFIIAVLIMSLFLAACESGDKTSNLKSDSVNSSTKSEVRKDEERNDKQNYASGKSEEETKPSINTVIKPTETSVDKLTDNVEKYVDEQINILKSDFNKFTSEISTLEKYRKSIDKVEKFYGDIIRKQKAILIRLKEYAVEYAKIIVDSNMSFEDKYDEIEVIHDVIYEDASDDIQDAIYDGIMDDMMDIYYDEMLEEAYEVLPYKEAFDLCSDEYDMCSDTAEDLYDDIYDFSSTVYDFYSDIEDELFDEDTDRANKKIKDFEEDIEKEKSDINIKE